MNIPQAHLAQQGVAFSREIATAATRHGIDPQLLAAVAAQETGGPGSNAGANIVGDGGHGRGLFQIDDRWHEFAKTRAAMDPAQNADYAAAMISRLLKLYGGDIHKALSAYNAGSPDSTGTITQWADGGRLGYADSVLKHYARLGSPGPATIPRIATPPENAGQLIADIFGEIQYAIEQTNKMQSLAQAAPQQPAVQFQPRSYSQLAGIDASGHSKHSTSWAGLLGTDDTN
ncbi:MAG: transglycosylase SLT domain-containing protein [Candidatus Baltobacteraceae bacterium]